MKRSLVGCIGLAIALAATAPQPARAATTYSLQLPKPLLAFESFQRSGCSPTYLSTPNVNGLVERVVNVGHVAGLQIGASFAVDGGVPNSTTIYADYLTGGCVSTNPKTTDTRIGPGGFVLNVPPTAQWVVFTMTTGASASVTF